MSSVQGPVACPAVCAKQGGVHLLPTNGPLMKAKSLGSSLWGFKAINYRRITVGKQVHFATVRCSFSSSSNGNDSMAENFRDNDSDYVNSSVTEAVEIKSNSAGFMIKMRDGKHISCVHNTHQGDHAPFDANPAIVLKMEDGTGLLLPMVVMEMPSKLLMAAMYNVQIARPTMYEAMKEMVDKMGYKVKLVRVTKKVKDAYFAELFLSKVDDETDCVSFDVRPSDAINIAVRCKVPIHVNKLLAYNDGLRVVEPAKMLLEGSSSEDFLFRELDRPSGQPCIETKEFDLVRNMLLAAVEERYRDAAQWRDKLTQLRSQRNWA